MKLVKGEKRYSWQSSKFLPFGYLIRISIVFPLAAVHFLKGFHLKLEDFL